MTTRWNEDRFENSIVSHIAHWGGTTSHIENKQHPGNADLLYSLDGHMGVIEAKSTMFLTRDNRIRLKHPLSSDQRKFLREHGQRCGRAFAAVMLSNGTWPNSAILFRWNEINNLLDEADVDTCKRLAAWSGIWPFNSAASADDFRKTLTGVFL